MFASRENWVWLPESYHGKQEAHHYEDVIVSCKCHKDTECKLTRTGDHQNGTSANPGEKQRKQTRI